MKCFKLYLIFLLVFGCCFIYHPGLAQNSTQNLTNVNVDDLSDSQILAIIQQGRSQGLSDDQIVQNAQSNGMSAAQAQKLRARMTVIDNKNGNTTQSNGGNNNQQTTRTLNYQADSEAYAKKSDPAQLQIFGADLFRTSNTTFEPNLQIATPVNYILGPGDQVDVSVYGQSVVNWKLVVSPEGNINLPSGGIINVAGKSIEDASAAIKQRLISKNYEIGHGTEVKVTLGDIRSIKVIMVGEVVKPGTYTLPSLATAFNALYLAGGPNNNGSFRQIEIIRNNRVIRHLDIYDFLVKGDQKDNISLQDQDIIRIPNYRTRVEMRGEVKDPAIFEVLPGESLKDVIGFAGGFTSSAYRASIKVTQISDDERRITDVTENDFSNYVPLPGDQYTVQGIINRFANRVTINGAVFRPGEYELQKGMTLSDLIVKAAGVKEDAFTSRGTITRLNPDNTFQLISFNIRDILNKTNNVTLQREDIVTIRSIFDLRDQYTVKIAGDVRNPGDFAYADSMKVENLILLAGGFKEGASTMRIEVARRVYNSDPDAKDGVAAKVFSIDVDSQLKPDETNFSLKPFDIVLVYSLPGYQTQGMVQVEGEVLYPGPYVIEYKNEKISDIIKSAGGLTASADAEGSTLKRNYVALLGIDKTKTDTTASVQGRMQRDNELKQTFKDSTQTDEGTRNNYIGIKLNEIIAQPGSTTDLIVKDGDVISVPQQQQVVQVNGEVHVPSGVVYIPGNGLRDYVLNAGGYAEDALKRGAYVIYPNGTVRGTHKFLFFNSHPKIRPGSEIFIPKKPVRHGLNLAELSAIVSALGTAAILAILSLRN